MLRTMSRGIAVALVALLALLAGCGGLSPKTGPMGAPDGRAAPSAPAQAEPTKAPEPPSTPEPVKPAEFLANPAPYPLASPAAAQPVPAAAVGALLDRLSQGGWTLAWEDPAKSGQAGLSTRNDRFYHPDKYQGFVQLGLMSWTMNVKPGGDIEWEGPFAGRPPQLPFLSELQGRPDWWGAATLLAGAEVLQGHSRTDGTERWIADLPPAGVEVIWHGLPVTMTGLELIIANSLPVSFTAQIAGEGAIQGHYTWEDPVLQAPTRSGPYLGLFGLTLGAERDYIETFVLIPAKRELEPDGSEWAYASNGRSIKYDPTGKVVTLVQTYGGLVNGLRVGDDRARALHLFPAAVESRPEILVQYYPDGSRLEIPVYGGKVFGFWAVAAGH